MHDKSIKVLIVDDEKDFVEMLSLILREGGISVTGVPGGNECLELLDQEDFDVVILDVWMPGMNGIETLINIKKNHPLVEVIMVTGHGSIQDAIEAMKIGAFDFLLKPTDYEDLISKLTDAHIKKRKQEDRIAKAKIKNLTQESSEKEEEIITSQQDVETKNESITKMVVPLKTAIKVLVVDDEKPFVELISLRLQAAGAEVSIAFNGNECLETLKQKVIDIVILDFEMPGMGGVETLRKIKGEFPLVEVIVLTAHGTVETAVEGMRLGAYDYLLKPTDFKDLKSKLEGAGIRKKNQEFRMQKALTTEFANYSFR
ncbi:response regulator [Thermodesulfobacteriota bacterium]